MAAAAAAEAAEAAAAVCAICLEALGGGDGGDGVAMPCCAARYHGACLKGLAVSSIAAKQPGSCPSQGCPEWLDLRTLRQARVPAVLLGKLAKVRREMTTAVSPLIEFAEEQPAEAGAKAVILRACAACHVALSMYRGCPLIQCPCGHRFCFKCGRAATVGCRCPGTTGHLYYPVLDAAPERRSTEEVAKQRDAGSVGRGLNRHLSSLLSRKRGRAARREPPKSRKRANTSEA